MLFERFFFLKFWSKCWNRLWGEHGQALLESAQLCLINVSALGTEILKNIVLPGIGGFTIVDSGIVTEEDTGCKWDFFTVFVQSRSSFQIDFPWFLASFSIQIRLDNQKPSVACKHYRKWIPMLAVIALMKVLKLFSATIRNFSIRLKWSLRHRWRKKRCSHYHGCYGHKISRSSIVDRLVSLLRLVCNSKSTSLSNHIRTTSEVIFVWSSHSKLCKSILTWAKNKSIFTCYYSRNPLRFAQFIGMFHFFSLCTFRQLSSAIRCHGS